MNKFSLCAKVIFLVWGLFSIISYPAFAEEQPFVGEQPVEELPLVTKRDACLNNFDINSIDFDNPKVNPFVRCLANCIQCRVGVKDNINECDNFKAWPEYLNVCRSNFNNFQALFARAIRDRRVTPGMFSLWVSGGTEKEFENFIQAFLKEDISICEKAPSEARYECRAVVTGDDSLCKTDDCANKAAYIKAIRSGNIDDCSRIKNPLIKAMCRGYISKDEKICEEEAGFKDFKNGYCQ